MHCRCVDIRGIVDHHSLSFSLFIIWYNVNIHTSPFSIQLGVCWSYNETILRYPVLYTQYMEVYDYSERK